VGGCRHRGLAQLQLSVEKTRQERTGGRIKKKGRRDTGILDRQAREDDERGTPVGGGSFGKWRSEFGHEREKRGNKLKIL